MPLEASLKFGSLVVKVRAQDALDLFVQASIFTELPSACAKCGCLDIGPMHRQQGNYEYFNLKCKNPECGAMFDIGQKKEGGLFPKENPERSNHVHGWYLREDQDYSQGDNNQSDRGNQGGGNNRGNQNQQRGNGNQGGGQNQQRGNGGGYDNRQPSGRSQQGGQQQRGNQRPQGEHAGNYSGPEDDIDF